MENSGENNKLLLALENITDEDLKLFDYKKKAESIRKNKIDLKSHLFTALKTSFQNMNFPLCAKLLKHLGDNGLCSREFVLQIITVLFARDSSNFQPSIYLNALTKFTKPESLTYEVRLLKLIQYLSEDSWEAASNVISCEGRQGDLARRDSTINSCSNLLLGFKAVLKYLTHKTTNQELPDSMLTEFPETGSHVFTPLIAEACTKTILELDSEEKAAEFIHKYVEDEEPHSGLLAPLHAFAIVKECMPTNKALAFYLLEKIAQFDCTHPLVLDLSWKYLCKDIPFKLEKDQTLSKCLELVVSFLDVNMENSRAWDILAQSLRMICISGEELSIGSVVKLWHRDRKSWWPNKCFPTQSQATEADSYIDNKTLVCFILESKRHPFVVNMLALKEGKRHNLQSLIKQLKKPKSLFDSQVKSLIDSTGGCPGAPLVEIPLTNLANSEISEIATTSVNGECPEFAFDYPVYMAGTLPIHKRRQDQSKILDNRENCLSLYQLPIIERLSKRYTAKKTVRNTDIEGEEASSSDSEDELVDNLVAPRSKFRPQIGVHAKERLLKKYLPNRSTARMTPPPSDIPRSSDSSSEDEAYHTRIAYSPSMDIQKNLRSSSNPCGDAHVALSSPDELEEGKLGALSGHIEMAAHVKSKWANFINEMVWEQSRSSPSEESRSEESDNSVISTSSSSSDSSKKSSRPSIPTEMTLLNLTPDLQFMVSPDPPPPQVLIRNEDHYAFLNLTQESERSGKNRVSQKVRKIIDNLDDSSESSTSESDESDESDESEIDIPLDDVSSKGHSDPVHSNMNSAAADSDAQSLSDNLSTVSNSGKASSNSDIISTSSQSTNDPVPVPNSPSPSSQNVSRRTENSSPDIFHPDYSNDDDEESVDCVLSSTQKSIALQLQCSLDVGYSTPTVASRKKLKQPPLSVIAHHPSARLRGDASAKPAKKRVATPLREKSKKSKISQDLVECDEDDDEDDDDDDDDCSSDMQHIQQEQVSPTEGIVEREMIIAELMSSCKQSVKRPSKTSKRRRGNVSMDEITSSIVDTCLKENASTLRSTGQSKKKSSADRPWSTAEKSISIELKLSNLSESSSSQNPMSQTTGSTGRSKKNRKKPSIEKSKFTSDQSSTNGSLDSGRISSSVSSAESTSFQLKAPSSFESSNSSRQMSDRTPSLVLTRIEDDASILGRLSSGRQSAAAKTRKNTKKKRCQVVPSFDFDGDGGRVPSFSEFSSNLDDSQPTSSQTATWQKKKMKSETKRQSDIDRRNMKLVDELLSSSASQPNKTPRTRTNRSKTRTRRSGDGGMERLDSSSTKSPSQSAPSETLLIDAHLKELVEQLYHQLEAEEQPIEQLEEEQLEESESAQVKSPKKMKSKSSKLSAWTVSQHSEALQQPKEQKSKTKSSQKAKKQKTSKSTYLSTMDQHNMELIDQLLKAPPTNEASLPHTKLKQKRSAVQAQLSGSFDEPPVKLPSVKSTTKSTEEVDANESLIDLLSDYVKHSTDD